MKSYDFSLVLNRDPDEHDFDRLFESGLDDAVIETDNGTTVAHFDRKARSLPDAVASAVHHIERAGFRAQAMVSEDLVSLKDIANRLGRTYESVRLWTVGKRGPGGFPPALSAGDGWALHSWAQVVDWLQRNGQDVPEIAEYAREIAIADHLVRTRALFVDPMEGKRWAELIA